MEKETALEILRELHDNGLFSVRTALETLIPELAESEDEKIRKEIVRFIQMEVEDETVGNKWIAWLEKQVEQKVDKCEGCNNVKRCITCVDGTIYVDGSEWAHIMKIPDKVEPKFKTGDYVVYLNDTYMLEDDGKHYILIAIKEKTSTPIVHVPYGNEDYTMHKWDITDVKDGDVLVSPRQKGHETGEQIFIFKCINNRGYVDNCIEYYCRVCDGDFYVNKTGYMGTTSSPLYPATKEQRDTLFTKIKEAGYEWNEKELKLEKI